MRRRADAAPPPGRDTPSLDGANGAAAPAQPRALTPGRRQQCTAAPAQPTPSPRLTAPLAGARRAFRES